MKLPTINPYNNYPYRNTSTDIVRKDSDSLSTKVQRRNKSEKTNDFAQARYDMNNMNDLISKRERDFFIKLFPENSEQLAKHEVFNRNGRVQSFNVSKGSIIDGRV